MTRQAAKPSLALEVIPIISIAKHYKINLSRSERALLWAPTVRTPINEEDLDLWHSTCSKVRDFYYAHGHHSDVERVHEFEDQIQALVAIGNSRVDTDHLTSASLSSSTDTGEEQQRLSHPFLSVDIEDKTPGRARPVDEILDPAPHSEAIHRLTESIFEDLPDSLDVLAPEANANKDDVDRPLLKFNASVLDLHGSEVPSEPTPTGENLGDYDVVSITSSVDSIMSLISTQASDDPDPLTLQNPQELNIHHDAERTDHDTATVTNASAKEAEAKSEPQTTLPAVLEDLFIRLNTMEHDLVASRADAAAQEGAVNRLAHKLSQAEKEIKILKTTTSTQAGKLRNHSQHLIELDAFNKGFNVKLKTAMQSFKTLQSAKQAIGDMKRELENVDEIEKNLSNLTVSFNVQKRMTDTFIEQTSIRQIYRTFMRTGQNPLPVPGLNGKIKPDGISWPEKEWTKYLPSQIHAMPVEELDRWLDHYNLGAATSDPDDPCHLECKNRRKLLRQFIGQKF
ncbi:hypothetical protein IAT40_004536 [Kwoniella sp. CBS 6097]